MTMYMVLGRGMGPLMASAQDSMGCEGSAVQQRCMPRFEGGTHSSGLAGVKQKVCSGMGQDPRAA